MPSNLIPIDISDPIWGRVAAPVLLDPSPRQIARFAAKAPRSQLRGTACCGKLLVFPAWNATHMQIRRAFGLPDVLEDGTDFWVIPSCDEPLSSDWGSSQEDLVRDGLRLILGARADDPSVVSLVSWFSLEVASRPALLRG